MKVHRFYVSDVDLRQDFWLHEETLLHQWNKVLRFRPGQQVVLFDGKSTDRLYEVVELSQAEAHLKLKTELSRKLPSKHVYLFWSLLKKDNNDLVLQKCTELGVTNFVPIISQRAIRKDFNIERAEKIIIEASEQCGRSDIPAVREPIRLQTAIDEYKNKIQLIVCDEKGSATDDIIDQADGPVGVFIGPEGGWSEAENKLFKDSGFSHLSIHDFTLRAETAAIKAVAHLA
jgi:16S rRNA (uracil1498-N3)-methyltransferase